MKKILTKFFSNNNESIHFEKRNGGKGIYQKEEFLRLIRIERERVHRNEMYFSLILFKINTSEHANGAVERLIERLRNRVRKIDQIGWYDDGLIGVLLPDTPASGAQIVIRDIIKSGDGGSIPLECETITYPESGRELKRRELNG